MAKSLSPSRIVATVVDFPAAPVLLERNSTAWRWLVTACPVCGGVRRHVHGGGLIDEDPRGYLGSRVLHCGPRHGVHSYNLYDADPSRTLRLIQERKFHARGICSEAWTQ